MRDRMVVVQWADLTGTGFSQQRRGCEAPAEFWSAAEGLLNADLAQPPEGILDTGQHPIWTLRQVLVGRRRTWCFAVQGRRGEPDFGVAGTCRFAFAPQEFDAVEAWRHGIEATRVRPAERQMSAADFAAGVRQVLRSVVAGQDRIPVGLAPADTAWVIACVLRALPESEARNWSWSTCVLLPPGRTKRREVSGVWPEEFRTWEPRLARAVAASLEEPVATTQDIRRLLDPPKIDGFEELVDQVVRGKVHPDLRCTSRNLEEVISRIGRSARKPGIDDVADMVVAPMGAEELNDHYPKLLSEWAAKRPDEAARQLRHVTHPGAVRKIVAKLLTAQQHDPENLLGLPTVRRPWPDTWHHRLVEILRDNYQPRELEKPVGWWLAGVWADPDDAAAGRDFLRALGLHEHSHPRCYRARPDLIVEELNLYREVTAAVRTELSFEPDPLSLLASLGARLHRLPATTVVELIREGDRPNAARRGDGATAFESIAAGQTRAWLAHESVADTEDWVRGLVAQVHSDYRLAGHLLAGCLRALREHDADVPHDALLEVCRQVREQGYLPADTLTAIAAAERRSEPPHVPAPPAVARASVIAADPPAPAPRRRPDPPHRERPDHDRSGRRWVPILAHRPQLLKWVAGGGLATAFVAAPTVAIVVLLPPDTARDPAARNTPAYQSAAQPPSSPWRQPRTITLPPVVSQPRPDDDARSFLAQLSDARGRGDIVAVVLLAGPEQGAADRANRLNERLRTEVLLRDVPVKTLRGTDPAAPTPTGSLQVIVFYTE